MHKNRLVGACLCFDGEPLSSTRPLTYLFPSAGTYTVTGQYTHGNDTVTASIQVQAIDGSFPEENPACLVGRERSWHCPDLSSNLVFEADASVELESGVEDVEIIETLPDGTLTTNNQQQTTVSLKANDTNGDHVMLARLYPNGPILDSARLDPFWIQNAVDGYVWTVERYEDSELWEVEMVTKQVPDSVDVQIKVIIAGVTLDDYTLARWLTNADLDEIGEYDIRLFHPNDEEHSVCHTIKVYQDEQFIGEAFYSGQEEIDAE